MNENPLTKTSPRVSVIIPAHNSARFLPETLASVRAQTFQDWELLVVDDRSTDNTAAIVTELCRQDARVRLIPLEAAGGWAAPGRNCGFANSNPDSEFVVFLDHDDVWEPYALEALTEALDEHPEAVGAHGFHRCIDAAGEEIDEDGPYIRMSLVNDRLVKLRPDQPTTFATLVPWCCMRTPGLVLARRAALPHTNPCPQYDGTGLDWDLWLNLSRMGDFVFVNRMILAYRVHETSMTRDFASYKQRIAAVRRRLWEGDGFTEEQRRLVRRGFRAVEAHGAKDKLRLALVEVRKGAPRATAFQCRYALAHLLRCVRGRY